jgi:DNA-binding MarR family transcriptional regulator
MAEPDEIPKLEGIFSEPHRLAIMLLLYLHRKVKFKDMQKLLHLTPGNLDHHVRRLEQAGYIKSRYILSWRPLVVIEITRDGAEAFRDYATRLRRLLEKVE